MLGNNDTSTNSHNAGDERTATGSNRQHDNNASSAGRSFSAPVSAGPTSAPARPRPAPAATRSYLSRSSSSTPPSTPPASRSTRLSRQSKVSHSIIKSGTTTKQQKPSPIKSNRLTAPATSLPPRQDGNRASRKGDPVEARRTVGRGSKSSAAAGNMHAANISVNISAAGAAPATTKPVSKFRKDIVATYHVFNHAKRLDKLLRKFKQFEFIKTKPISSAPSGPPPIYPFSTPSATSISSKRDSGSALAAGGRTGAVSTRLNTCDNSVNSKTSTTLIEHFVSWRRRKREQSLGSRSSTSTGKTKKPRRTAKPQPKPVSKDTSAPALNAFISKQNPTLVQHLRRHSLVVDPKDEQYFVRELYSTSRHSSAIEDAPTVPAPVPEVVRPLPPAGPPIIPLDKEFHSPSKGFQSSKKDESKGSGDKQTASSSKGHKTSVAPSVSNIRSSPPLINLSPQLLSPVSKPGTNHAHKPPKKFNDKMRAEAAVIQRLTDLQKQGMMYESRLPKLEEPSRIKCHWDYLLEEMAWMAADFTQERKWKNLAARKCARMIEKYWKYREELKKKIEKEEAQEGQKIAAFIAKEVKNFWANVQRLVEFKEMAKIEELRKKTVDLHLSMMVDQTEKFADMVASSFNPTADAAHPPTTVEETPSQEVSVVMDTETASDDDFKPDGHESDDDEETIAKADAEAKDVNNEVDLLAKESTQDLSEIYPQWLLDKITGKSVGDGPMSPSASSEAESDQGSEESGSENGDDESESRSTDESDAEKEPEVLKDNDGQTWDLTSLIRTFSPESKGRQSDQELHSVTQMAQSFQPTGCTLSSTKVKTKVPVLLKHTLREYQHVGLDWLVTMFEKKLNGILADEMGLGKTIQTIALLAHLACEKSNWGPHLIIVPTSVMLNWEMEFKKWCPGFKILTYYGSVKDRRLKRKGWTRPNAFHVCITSYKLVVQDHHVFRRKAWKYLILDEAQNIKNFKSQRWQLLLNFNARRRLLLTGTPLQNNLMELWSLLHFLMPNVFQSHREFREWFSNPVTGMVEGSSEYNENIIRRLHKVLRPFILRRLKSEVEKQLPQKHEHVVLCPLSKRQRFLYEEFMSRTRTRETLATGNLLSVINVLMQLRKVCNHPNLFESRPIISPLRTEGITIMIPSLVWNMLEEEELKAVHFALMKPTLDDHMLGTWKGAKIRKLVPPRTSLKLTARLVLEEMVEANGCLQGRPENGRKYTKNTYSFKDERVFYAPRSKKPFPIVLVSDVDPTQYFEDREFFGALCDEANRLNKNQTAKPRYLTPPRRTRKRLADSYPEEIRRPAKISKLSTGQIEFVRTSSGKAGLVLTGSSYANGLTSNITEAGEISPITSEDEVVIVNAAPLSYSSALEGRQISADSPSSSEDSMQTPPKPKFGPDGQEEYVRPKAFVKHLSLLSKMSENQRTAQVEYNPFFEFRRNIEAAANVIHSHIAQSSSVTNTPDQSPQKQSPPKQPLSQKRKHSEDEVSDEYEDSDEDTQATDSSSQARSETYRASKREFRPEDASLESSVIRNLKRIDARNFDAEAGLTWLRANNIDPSIFQRNDLEYRRLMDRKHVILRMNAINRARGKVFPFYGYDLVDACRVCGVPDLTKSFNAVNPLRRDFNKSGYFKFGYNEVETYRIMQNSNINREKNHLSNKWRFTSALISMIGTSETIIEKMIHSVLPSVIYIPSVETPPIQYRVFHPSSSCIQREVATNTQYQTKLKDIFACLHPITTRMATQFPDPRLIQYDCGKLQKLDLLLRRLSNEKHRVLIFTQMTKMLDVLEAFLNYHGYIYLRLDGSTKIDQRQLLMEKFNTDRKIFCFILSTRSGGIGVNLTGADTVIFYDSDWNPTMDAQAQDRCHRIGQTRDVHIYRLVSEKTVEENILVKSNQKRLLGELAIEGGNFTTAFFKKNTIRDLFDTQVVLAEEPMFSRQDQEQEKENVAYLPQELSNGDKTKSLIMETALASAEDESDVQAARTVRAEAAAELAEFDESIPLETVGEAREFEEPPSAAAAEIELIMSELTPVERLAFKRMEETLHEWTTETYESAARVVENQKRQWELDQLAMDQQRLAPPVVESSDDEEMITYPSADAQNKVWLARGSEGDLMTYMPLWQPPTPPSDDTDVYIDTCLQTLYHKEIIPEHELPPVYVPPLKKKATISPKPITIPGYPPLIPSPTQMDISSDQKKLPLKPHKREEPIFAPKSLFERPNPQVNKLRRDFKLQKHNRPAHVSPTALPPVPSKALGPDSISFPVVSPPLPKGAGAAGLDNPPWNVQEDNALLEGVSAMCELPQSLIVLNPSQTVNWDLICEHLNQTSVTHRSPKQCKTRYETVVGPREEGKMIFDSPALVKKKKSKAFVKIGPPSPQRARPQVKTAQLMLQDNYQKYTEVFVARFEAMRNLSARKLNQTLSKPPGTQKVAKQSMIFTEHGINYDTPQTAQSIALARLERIQLERRKVLAAQEAARIAAQEAARIAAQTPIGTITLPAGQTISVQGGVQQPPNSLLLQTLPQKLTPAQMEILKQNLVMSAQLRQNQLAGAAPLRPPYQRPPDPASAAAVSLQGVKRIQVVPNSVQSTLGGVSFAITSSSVTTTAQQATIIPFSSTVSAQNSPIIQSQLQSSNISPGTIYQRNAGDPLSVHNVKRIQVMPNSIQSVGGVTFALTAPVPAATSISQPNIIALNTSMASQLSSLQSSTTGQTPQMVGPLPPVSVFQRGAEAVSLQGVKRIQVVSNTIQPAGITFAVSTTAASAPTSHHSVISISAPMVSLGSGGGATTGQVNIVHGQPVSSAPIITMAPAASAVSTVQSLGTLLSTTTSTPQRFQGIQGPAGTPLTAIVRSQGHKPGQPQPFISSHVALPSLSTLRPVIVRPRMYSPQQQQQIHSLQMQQLTQQQAQLVVSSGTSQHSIFTLSSPITSTGQGGQRVTLVQQAPIISVTTIGTGTGQSVPIISVPSSQLSALTTTTASNLQARLQALPISTSGAASIATLVKGTVGPKGPAQTFISTPIQYTPVKPGTTTQAQIPTQLIVQATSKQQLPASLQQFQQVFKQVIFRQPVQMLQGQTVAVSLGGTLARPAVSQAVPIRTTVPISAIAQISAGQPQAQARRLPLTLPLNTISAAVSAAAAAAATATPSDSTPTGVQVKRFQVHPPIISAAPLIPNISKEATPPVIAIKSQAQTAPPSPQVPTPIQVQVSQPESGTSATNTKPATTENSERTAP